MTSITAEEGIGLARNWRSERQENVLIETMIITAVSAATCERDDASDHDRGIEADLRIDAGDYREADGLWT